MDFRRSAEEREAEAPGVGFLIVAQKTFAVAPVVLDVQIQTKAAEETHRGIRQVKLDAAMVAILPHAAERGELQAAPPAGDGAQVHIAAIVGQVFIVIKLAEINPRAGLEGELKIIVAPEGQRGLDIEFIQAVFISAALAVGFVLQAGLQIEPEPVRRVPADDAFPAVEDFRFVTRVIKRRIAAVQVPERGLGVGDVKSFQRRAKFREAVRRCSGVDT